MNLLGKKGIANEVNKKTIILISGQGMNSRNNNPKLVNVTFLPTLSSYFTFFQYRYEVWTAIRGFLLYEEYCRQQGCSIINRLLLHFCRYHFLQDCSIWNTSMWLFLTNWLLDAFGFCVFTKSYRQKVNRSAHFEAQFKASEIIMSHH